MLKPKKKITKKEIKEDKFVQTTMQAKNYIEDNYKKVAGITAAIFAIFILIMGYSYIHQQTIQESSTILGKAQLEYQNLNYGKARQLLVRLLDEYSGTEAAGQGTFLLANLYFQEDNTGEAKSMFKEFIDSNSGNLILQASGLAGYAACLEREGKYAEAASYYKDARKKAPEFVEAANYLYLAGKNYMRAGELDNAIEQFNTIKEKYENSSRKDDAEEQLILLTSK